MPAMKRLAAILAFALVGCPEPSKVARYEQVVTGLQYLHSWDPVREAEGQFAYDAVMGSDDHVLFSLTNHITDETPTAIHDRIANRTVVVGDVCFLLLLKKMNKKWEDFSQAGVFQSKLLPNPVFGLKWDPGARARVKQMFLPLLPSVEELEEKGQ